MAGAIGPHGPGQPAGPRVRLVPGSVEVAAAAAGCRTWAELVSGSSSCTACAELAATRTTVVVGEAPAGARLALVGEAPGADEDRAGRPFVGRAGRLLDDLLAEVGLDRSSVAVLNVLQCRPPGNRMPAGAEVARCRGWLDRKLALIGPELVVALGLTAAGWFLGRGVRLGAVRGVVHEVDGRRVLPTYHPSAAIRYGPAGEPLAGLRADLALAARLLATSRPRPTLDAE
jgi:uracil-DNA glycosylase family 4